LDETSQTADPDGFPNGRNIVIMIMTYWERSQEFDEIESSGEMD
jgi:hypothetical protein